jgi:regulator of RNase E activity RraA
MGFQLYARNTSGSHAYAHIIEFSEPVEIDGLKVSSGDLLYGDLHGVLSIPLSTVAKVSLEAAKIRQEERELIEFCRSSRFTLHELGERLKSMNLDCNQPWEPHQEA